MLKILGNQKKNCLFCNGQRFLNYYFLLACPFQLDGCLYAILGLHVYTMLIRLFIYVIKIRKIK